MNFFRLLWSFVRKPARWLEILEAGPFDATIYVPSESTKTKPRTMWD